MGEDVEFTLAEAADYAHVTKTAIYKALYQRRIKAHKQGREWRIKKSDLDSYRSLKYHVHKRVYNGEKIFDVDRGHFSVLEVATTIAEMLGRPYNPQKIYYYLRIGSIRAVKKGTVWVITREDAIDLYNKELEEYGELRVS